MSIIKKQKARILAIALWLCIWQGFSWYVGNEILLASPMDVLIALFGLLQDKGFYLSIIHSVAKIAFGFVLAVIVGILLAFCSSVTVFLNEMIAILIRLIKSIPVASFVILTLLWVRSQNLSILISFFMVLPIIYLNVLNGIQHTDNKLLEMAKVFNLSFWRKIRYIYLPEVIPYFTAACSASLGLCWKAGIAAEVIGLPMNSIGEKLYEAKIYLMTKELFAWTIVIVLISIVFEKFIMAMIRKIEHYILKGFV